MDNHFTLSVIIPVYNCECFIEKAIASVIAQPVVTEIVVVNDGSTDKTGLLLDQLQKEIPILKIFHHQNKWNKGRSASRNLGIQKATGDYIAFLDADDYYLENRFSNDFKFFATQPDCDGVYNAVGFHFYNPVAIEYKNEMERQFTLTQNIEPKRLFDALLNGTYGYFHINGLTLKKEVFEKIGLFNTKLIVSEDSDLFWRLALKCTLVTGNITQSVAKRGIHTNNAFNNRDLYEVNDIRLYESMYEWSAKNNVPLATIERFLERMWILRYRKQERKYKYFFYWVQLNRRVPKLLFTYLSVKYFPLVRYLQKRF
ncbi:glycosyltransferase family 2 protein [Flavobacterium sp. XS1P27]|uniref:glycosyltransferase family 2 protein n=1 Tax=Flavobacterium sp. XS1P27 TaxID=3401724 RepID=UPI003AAA9C4D